MADALRPSLPAIVVLEDEPSDVVLVHRAIEKAAIANPVIAFSTAEQARRYVEGLRPDTLPALFILDGRLQGGESGIAFLRWLRGHRLPLGTTPAVVLTGSQRPDDEDDAAMLGTIYFLHKPVTQQDLTAAVEVLRLRRPLV